MEQQNLLKIQVKCKVNDIFRYNLWVGYKSFLNKVIAIVGLGLIVYFLYGAINTTSTLDVFVAQNLLVLLLGLFLVVGKPLNIWKITMMQMQTPALAKGTTYVFSAENISLSLGDLSEEIKWDVYTKIVETKNDFRFFVSQVEAQLIPKHMINEAQMKQLRALIKEALPEEKYQLKTS
jgi:hypothetical protein